MTLKDKFNKYLEKHKIPEGEQGNAKADYENGYKECKSEILEFIRVNPKASTKQIENYLNSL